MAHEIGNPSAKWIRPGAGGVRAVLRVACVVTFLASCIPMSPGSPPQAEMPPAPSVPPLEEGPVDRSQIREASRLLEAAREALAADSPGRARAAADSVISGFSRAPGSGEALAILSRALEALGRTREAADAAHRYVDLLGPSHPYFSDALLSLARLRAASGEADKVFQILLLLPAQADPGVASEARGLFREFLDFIPPASLREAALATRPEFPLRGVLATRLGRELYLAGELEEADRWARAALDAAVQSVDREVAQAVLDRRLEEVLGLPVALGAILPRTGVSPGLLEYGEWVHEGIQVAVEEFRRELRRPVDLQVVDDEGTAPGGRTALRSLQDSRGLGAVGPLLQDVLEEVAEAREGEFPLISPSSYLPPEEASGVYSLSGPDPGGARALAEYARELGLQEVAIVRPATEEAGVDARVFQEAFRELGGLVPQEIIFDSGATFFQPQFEKVASLLPDGLFLPLSPAEIELLAPQVTFYGLDTLGIQLLGTAGWARDEVVLKVDSRHTDGVIAATTRTTQDETDTFKAFRAAYEAQFHKTLRSEVPAFGYDAAALLLTALGRSPRTPGEMTEALEEIEGFPGATGRLTIDGGWIMREPHLIRIQDHELIYIRSRYNQAEHPWQWTTSYANSKN